ncbi:MAG TPA: multicopper oxidase domain-containing protein, partial [Acidimicrobiales bacterium]
MRRIPFPRTRPLQVVAVVAALFGACTLSVGGLAVWAWGQAKTSNVGELSFARELAIPPLAEPRVEADGTKVFDLRFTAGETRLRGEDEPATPTWGLNGTYLGPTLRASRGDTVRVEVTNGVDEATTLHWHGMHLPARMDGGPHQLVAPGDTWTPEWTIDQPAATLWYHPHLHGRTAEHVYRGAAGLFLLDDPAAADVAEALPHTYGVDDIPLIIQDKAFEDDGRLKARTQPFSNLGVMGDTILVNGTYDPHVVATTELVRFRLLNASNARIYNLGFTDDRTFHLIATDSGLLEQPYATDRIQLSPGERAEIVVAVEPGDRAVLRSFDPDLDALGPLERFSGGDDTFDILQVRSDDELAPSTPLPDRLADIDRPDPSEATRTRTFRLSGTSINGRTMDMDRVDEIVPDGATEIWEVRNDDGFPH